MTVPDNQNEADSLRNKMGENARAWEKKTYPSATFDLLPINADTLIAATRFIGIIITTNAGRTWAKLATPGLISKLTIDSEKQLWGLYSWQGIHEADRSILYLSKNLGGTWEKYELKTKEIFPSAFYSQPHEALKVIDYNHRIYQLTNNHAPLSWSLIDSIPKSDDTRYDPWTSEGFRKDAHGRQWAFNYKGIFLIDKDTSKVY